MRLVPKGWAEFQHYKNRNPPWIRLHRKLLDNKEFQRLPVASRALAPMLWLLASESMDGSINADADDLAFRLRQSEEEIGEALKPLISKGFFIEVEDAASTVLAPDKQLAPKNASETETETEEIPAAPARLPKRKPQKAPMPEDFVVSERVRVWAAGKGYGQLDDHLEAFKRKASANGYVYANWDDALMEAIREDWAKLRGRKPNGVAPPPEQQSKAGWV